MSFKLKNSVGSGGEARVTAFCTHLEAEGERETCWQDWTGWHGARGGGACYRLLSPALPHNQLGVISSLLLGTKHHAPFCGFLVLYCYAILLLGF